MSNISQTVYNNMEERIYDCKYNGVGCTTDINTILRQAEKKQQTGHFVKPENMKTDMETFVPEGSYGYYTADGKYVSID